MKPAIVLDASPIVAIFRANESLHARCVESLRDLRLPLHTTYPVLTEAHYLLRSDRVAQHKLLLLQKNDIVQIHGLPPAFLEWAVAFSEHYDDQEVQLADASLVWLANQLDTTAIFTLDRRDFSIYRRDNGLAFDILPG